MKVNKKILALLLASAIATSNTGLLFAASNSEQTKQKIKLIEQDKATINKKTKAVNSLIDSTNTKLHNTKADLESTLADKIKNERLLEQTKKDLNEGISNLKDKMTTYYMDSFSANGSALEMAIKSESISDYIVKITHLEKIVDKQDEFVNEVEALYVKQNEIVNEIKENEQELKVLKDKLDKDINKLNSEKNKFENDLKELNKKQEDLEDILVVQQEEEERIKQEIIAAQLKLEKEREAAKKAQEANVSNSSTSNSTNSKSNKTSNTTNSVVDQKLENSSTQNSWASPAGTYRVTSRFGYRNHPVTGKRHLHGGIDLAAATGTPIYSVKSGSVITSAYSSSYGNYIIVDHGNGLSSLYAHLSERGASVGTKVSKGQYIGKMGSTGMSTGPHLHFEIRKNGERVNPESYMRF